jgi:hypothetical protein
MKNESLTDAERMFTHAVMFKEGIVPMEDPHMDIRRALAGVTPEEARKLKRKFRKLWRSLRKSDPGLKRNSGTGHIVKPKPDAVDPVVEIQVKPSKAEKLVRKMAVHKHLRATKILPLVKQFNSLKDVLT